MSRQTENDKDGYIEVTIDEDRMRAVVDFYPPKDGGERFTMETVMEALKNKGVVWGIDEGALTEKILECLGEVHPVKGFVAALGRPPRKAVPAYWHVKKRLITPVASEEKGNQLDHRTVSPYVLVKRGEALAKKVPENPEEPGMDVTGKAIPAGRKDITLYEPGENITEKEDVLYAVTHGRFEIDGNSFRVNETLEIPGNVDYSTGHVVFPGDVIIHGEIRDGFRVSAGGSIYIKGTMDASQVLCRKDLHVAGGIKGRKEALVRVAGMVETKFVENCTIEAHGGLTVGKSVVHSRIFTLGKLDLSDKGILVGGEIWAARGVVVEDIGRTEGPGATIRVGANYEIDRKLRHVGEHMARLEQKLDHLKTRGNSDKIVNLISQVEVAMEKMRVSEKKFREELVSDDTAGVEVRGTVHSGTEIVIAGVPHRVTEDRKAVLYRYDSEGPRVVETPL